MARATDRNFFRSKYNAAIAYGVAVLLFLLPFVQLKFIGLVVAQNSGLELVSGSDMKLGKDLRRAREATPDYKDSDDKPTLTRNTGSVQIFGAVALALGIIGIFLAFARGNTGVANMTVGILAAASMIVLMIQTKSHINSIPGIEADFFSENEWIAISFSIWFYLSLVCFLAAAFLSFKRGQIMAGESYVPRNAPQVHINNPGDQSDFPRSASESEIG